MNPETGKYYYKAVIQYDGTDYCGFQWQKDIPTIQNDLNLAIQKIVPGKITTMGASRTDTGVHAMDQVVKFTSENAINIDSNYFNQHLPSQIRCLSFEPCSGEFKPANDPISKEYRYFFSNKKNTEIKDQKFIANNPFELNIDSMKACLKLIPGTHNFQNFCSTGSNVKSTEREIILCELEEVNPNEIFGTSALFKVPSDLETCYQLRIVGNGFLKQMVRHIVSGLWMVGNHRITVEDFGKILNGPKKKQRLWKVAPAQGLFLYKINY